MNFQDELKKRTDEIESVIASYLPVEEGFAKTMAEAMNYSVLAGGKRLRPMLILETLRMFGGDENIAYPFMAAMEMIHTHSLVHDDLPALDNDDYRRGRLTTHKVYGEAMGVLSGVALLNFAYEVMLTAFDKADTQESQAYVIQALKVMSHKTGLYGMLGGQSVDVENDGKPMSREMIDYIYENKTSALIEASMMTGAILGGAAAEETATVEKAAKNIGLAFQIQDDILDVTSTAEELGKPIHSDEKNHKTTYVTLMGIGKASQQVKALSDEAVALLEGLNKKNEFLFTLLKELVGRRK
ncbi:polyprenyl synthetase family protein [Blautia glucerasea]|uniref:polyprenyl synthetase family protein n=1 Tax=Blautia glucerasea TaxID=536633 RepID=UPI001D01A070|nr:farnesyl diphosphate synthase [Blautia glucerasea]MCB5386386.1 polyprenyl synthetase family protein [Blautia glucerasea]MCB5420741.1 polyprenyl synthetase family protein [Blautia luti]